MDEKVCPPSTAKFLQSKFRKILQNPEKILKKYIKKDMIVADLGCGPGFFTVEMAKFVGNKGKVIAADLQNEMLSMTLEYSKKKGVENIIELHKCSSDCIGIEEKIDFALAFYMVHEVPNIECLFKEIKSILKKDGIIYVAEPTFHVSKSDYKDMLNIAIKCGLKVIESKNRFFNRIAVFTHQIS